MLFSHPYSYSMQKLIAILTIDDAVDADPSGMWLHFFTSSSQPNLLKKRREPDFTLCSKITSVVGGTATSTMKHREKG